MVGLSEWLRLPITRNRQPDEGDALLKPSVRDMRLGTGLDGAKAYEDNNDTHHIASTPAPSRETPRKGLRARPGSTSVSRDIKCKPHHVFQQNLIEKPEQDPKYF